MKTSIVNKRRTHAFMLKPTFKSLFSIQTSMLLLSLFVQLYPASAQTKELAQKSTKPSAQNQNKIPPKALSQFKPSVAIQKSKNRIYQNAKGTFTLTHHPELQEHIESLLNKYEVPQAALVAIEPNTGRLLAFVNHSKSKTSKNIALDASPPAASVFKVVTGAALVAKGIKPSQKVCYHGGFSKLTLSHLENNPKIDTACATLAQAMGSSINCVFAKLADKHLDKATMHQYASAFGFGHALPFDAQTQASQLEIPKNRLEFARTAAGFWHMHMSPFHGAVIAATIANDGQMMRPTLIEKWTDKKGKKAYVHNPQLFRAVIPRHHAKAVAEMMEYTVSQGTAKKSFFDPQGKPFLPGIKVAGKTGTLTGTKPYRGYSWWVGFAPAEKPKIALAALLINPPKWRIKSSYLAREALRYFLIELQKPQKQALNNKNNP